MIDSGPHDARIMLIGQSPSKNDMQLGKYFSGSTGMLLKQMLSHAKIKFEDCYVTCVATEYPIRGQFKYYYDERPKRPSEHLQKMQAVVRDKINKIKPNVVIALGAEALKAITNKKSIEQWRGSILTYNDVKIISTYNPTAVVKNYNFHPIVEMDLKRAQKESTYSGIEYDEHSIVIKPDLRTVLKWTQDAVHNQERVAFDIETIGKHVRCISLARMVDDIPEAITIPFIKFPSSEMVMPGDKNIITLGKPLSEMSNYWTKIEEFQILEALSEILELHNIQCVGHNSISFDAPLIEQELKMVVTNHTLDTMHAFHLLYSELPMGLKFISTIMTNFPNYWSEKVTNDDNSEWYYCAMDSICTLVIADKIEKELHDANMWDLYQHINDLAICITRVQERGICVDDEIRKKLLEEKSAKVDRLLGELRREAGDDFNPASPKQVKELLYEKLRLPQQTKQGKVTTDETALRKLAVKFPEHKVIRNLIGYRKVSKLVSTFLDMSLIEGKMVTSYNTSGTKSGRLSSSKTLWGTGMNLQNIPVGKAKGVTSVRHLFIPSKGKVWIKADLSQAEALVVSEILYRHGDPTIKKMYQDPSFDIHNWMAAKFLNKKEIDISKKEREAFGKIPNHSGNYGAGPMVMVVKAAKEEIEGINYHVANRILEARHKAIPGLRKWWKWVESELQKSRTLTTCFGRRRIFFGRLDGTTYRDAYSFEPQSIVGDVTNRILTKLENNHLSKLTLLMQVHDEVDGECYPEDVAEVVKEIQEAAVIPIYINKEPLIIPIDIEIGNNWGDTIDYREWQNGR